MLQSNNETGILPIAIVAIVALIVGFVAGNYFLGQGENGTAQYGGFTQSDRNFLVTVANGEVELISARVAAIVDWCTANGGQWNIVQQNAQVPVNEQIASQLTQAGADVRQDQNGNYIANVAVLSRDTCIFPIARGG